MNGDTALVDTNILVYAYDATETEKHLACRGLVESCWRREAEYAISIQNISEFFVITTTKIDKPISIEDAQRSIERIIAFNNWIKIRPELTTVSEAIKICREYKIHYWDALLAATMRENRVFKIYTENEDDFKKIPWLEVTNPLVEVA